MKPSKLLYIITAALSVGNVSACSSALECAYRGSIAPTTNTGFTLATGLGGQKARIGGEYTVEDAGQTTTVAIDAKTS